MVYFDLAEIPVPLVRSNTSPQTVSVQANFQGYLTDGICYPPMKKTLTLALPAGGAADAPDAAAPSALLQWLPALLLALLGGLILNLMPCVLPVLSFKAMALAKANTPGHARSHALWYTDRKSVV